MHSTETWLTLYCYTSMCVVPYLLLCHAGLALDLRRLKLLAHSAQQLAQALNILSSRILVILQQALDATVHNVFREHAKPIQLPNILDVAQRPASGLELLLGCCSLGLALGSSSSSSSLTSLPEKKRAKKAENDSCKLLEVFCYTWQQYTEQATQEQLIQDTAAIWPTLCLFSGGFSQPLCMVGLAAAVSAAVSAAATHTAQRAKATMLELLEQLFACTF
eukprot:GHRR01012961.1.p1 GENE.GHRR01012961.1~~GHRR01012961.1.p1  ORF type:complete len:220 (-),score=66.57 GHRR01012961.1:905-1564(-)